MNNSDDIRYEIRNDIEEIIKMNNIDRNKFHEADKLSYKKITDKLYYTFCDYNKYPTVQTSYMWTRLRKDCKSTIFAYRSAFSDEKEYFRTVAEEISDEYSDKYLYLITDGGWVYEGVLGEMINVLCRIPPYIEEFYIFPKDNSWLIIHTDDGECMLKIMK
ncbi:MAG: hypothetical protein IJ446_09825 [Oscillospiraceae bacterium]|nr:hypothetical protein [Oscillospiraceae bacterium]